MADVSARPGQAKSAPVSRFELNPQVETRFSAFQTTFFARLIATPITIQPTDAKSQELPAMKVNAYGLLGHNKSPKFVSFTTDNRQSRMAMPRMSHAP